MADVNNNSRKKIRSTVFRALKATVKSVLVYLIYYIIWMFLAPISEYVPSLQQMIENFVIIYISLMIIGDLTSGTIFQYFVSVSKSLFVIAYLILSLKGGIFGITFQNVNLTVDLRLFLTIAILLSLLGLSKSLLQTINFLNEKAEPMHV